MNLAVGILQAIVGLGMIGFWAMHIRSGGLPRGLRTLESGGYIAFHVTAETLTGVLCLLAGITVAMDVQWGYPVGLWASGMLLYTGINSLAWKEVRNKPAFALMFIVPTLIAVFSIGYLLVKLV